MHCCQCHYFIACCCQLVDCCSLFIQRISCYAFAAMQLTPPTLLLLPPTDFLHPFTQSSCGHSCRQHRCYCAMMLLPLHRCDVLLLFAWSLFTVAAIAIATPLPSIVAIALAIFALAIVALTVTVLSLALPLPLPSPSMPLPFPLLLPSPSPSPSLSLSLPFPFSFPWRRRRHHCPCCCRWLLVASSNFRIYILLLVGLVVAVTNCWMTAVAISASTFALCNLKAASIDYFLFYLYNSVWNRRSLVWSRMFHPAKEEIIFHIVCSRTKEYQSYGLNDPIISKFAGQRSCYATSGVCPSPAKVAWWFSSHICRIPHPAKWKY